MPTRVMKPIRAAVRIVAPLSALFAFVLASSEDAAASPSRRFALLVGQNDGGTGTGRLRYSEADADKFASVLRELGGYRDEDIVRVKGGSADDVRSGLARLESKIKAAKNDEKASTMLIVYYSGHGKDGDLRMSNTRFPMAELRQRLRDSSADLKLGIIDACESGAITREKGGHRGPSFLFDTDDREAGKGLILISSSSADETSQESDELGGSFFTHYLTSGLRGDADESGDHRVTLNEVYQYTYNKTVSVTANTRSGTQHPTFSYDFKGNGDVILTDLSQGTSGVVFGDKLSGDFLIFDMKHEQVAAEIRKENGFERRIALPPGDYVVKKRLADHLRMRRFNLAANRYYAVNEDVMERVEFADDYAKGVTVETEIERAQKTRVGFRALAMYQAFFSSDARNVLVPPLVMVGLGTDLAPIWGAKLGVEALVGGKQNEVLTLPGLNVGYDFFEAEFAASLMWSASFSLFGASVGPRISGIYFKRSFPNDEILVHHPQDHFGLAPDLAGAFSFFPGDDRDFSMELHVHLGLLPFSVDQNRTLFFGEVGLSMGYRL